MEARHENHGRNHRALGHRNHVNNFTPAAAFGDSTMKTEPIILITRVGMIFFSLLALYMLLLIIFGNSPTITDVLVVMTSSMAFYLVQNGYHQGKFEGELREFKSTAIGSFKNIKQDMDTIKATLQRIEYQRRR